MFLEIAFVIGILLFQFDCSTAARIKPDLKLVIDHDGGADDAMAITMSLLYEKYFDGPKVVGLTTTYGNVNLSQVIINSGRILELCHRRDVPIYVGSEQALIKGIETDHYFGYDGLGDDGFSQSEPVKVENKIAAVALIKLSKKYEGKLIVMAIGPLANVALAIRLDPNFIDRLAHLYVGAGHVYSEEQFSEPEFNADMDPEAYYIVATSAKVGKVTFVPYSQIINSLNITKEWREKVLGGIDTPIIKALNGYERVSLASSEYWEMLDPSVAAIVFDHSIVRRLRNTKNGIILCGTERGINTNNFTSTKPNSKLVYSLYEDRYKSFLLDVFSAELNQ